MLIVRGDLAGDTLALALRERGALVDDVVAYRTLEAPDDSRMSLRAMFASGAPDAVVFTSGSTVRGLVALAAGDPIDITSIPAICIGPETEAVARSAGFAVLATSATPDATVLATTAAAALTTLSRTSEIR